MAEAFDQVDSTAHLKFSDRWNWALAKAWDAHSPLLFGLRLWASVCLALYVAFSLELDNAFWAGTSAAIVCQLQLGASLRKGWFRMIGTLFGATVIVVMTACFPQDRIGFLVLLALWGALCAFTTALLHNFASYSAALAGYTAAIIAADNLGATGGASPDVFLLAVTRASEICIGIACAGVILAGTDLGGARRRLADLFANLAAEITAGFGRTLTLAGQELPGTKTERRELVRRVIALEATIDQALGESSQVRYHSPILQTAVHGLFRALDGWRSVATHLGHLPENREREQVEAILQSIPTGLRTLPAHASRARWTDDPEALCRVCEEAVRTLIALPASTPSQRLLADEAAKVLAGMAGVLDGIGLLVDAPCQSYSGARGFRPNSSDWLGAFVSATRAFVAIGLVELFWIATAWPNGASAIVFVSIVVLLLSAKGDLAYGGAISFALGTAGAVCCAAGIKFAVLPLLYSFPAFCLSIGLFLVPAGFVLARGRKPVMIGVLTAMTFNFLPLLAPTNEMNYDTEQFYNSALAIIVGCGVAPLAFWLLPPLSPTFRARRILALTSRDLRRLATSPTLPTRDSWESRVYGRLAVLPDQAEPLQRSQLLAALSVGAEIINIRSMAAHLGTSEELDVVLKHISLGNSDMAIPKLDQFDDLLVSTPEIAAEAAEVLRARSRVLIIAELLAEHGPYFDDGAPA